MDIIYIFPYKRSMLIFVAQYEHLEPILKRFLFLGTNFINVLFHENNVLNTLISWKIMTLKSILMSSFEDATPSNIFKDTIFVEGKIKNSWILLYTVTI